MSIIKLFEMVADLPCVVLPKKWQQWDRDKASMAVLCYLVFCLLFPFISAVIMRLTGTYTTVSTDVVLKILEKLTPLFLC